MPDNENLKAPEMMAKLRQQGDNMLGLYYQLKQERAQAGAQGWSTAFPLGINQDDTIPDGSVAPPINYHAVSVMTIADEFLTFMETGGRIDRLLAARRI